MSRKACYYVSVKEPDDQVIEALNKVSDKHPGYGFWKLYHMLRREGYTLTTNEFIGSIHDLK
ncbi:MAG TPA: hypothetical protein PK066_01065 [Saprospiraceae bacterium]|nr:hypothetical protein [Saprospiraceae bacterium]